MNKGIRFNKISTFRQHCVGQWPIHCWVFLFHVCSLLSSTDRNKKPQNFKILLQEKEYNSAISYQIKKGNCFNIYKSAYLDNIT